MSRAARDPIRTRIDANVFNYYRVPAEARIERCDPLALVSPDRLDLMARYVFVRQREQGWAVGWGTSIYRHLLESWNAEFRDGDGRKSSFTDYLRHFTALIDDVSLNGYDQARGLVPYTGNTVVDDAHRLATALYFNQPVDAVRLEGPVQKQDAAALLRIGMSAAVVEQLVNEYLTLDEDCYATVFFPAPWAEVNAALSLLAEKAHIIHAKDISLTEQGRRNLIELLYGHEPWWNVDLLDRFVRLRFPNGGDAKVVFVKTPPGEGSRPTKEHVRQAFPGLHYVHMNDTHRETRWIGDLVLNPTGVKFLNLRPTFQPKRFRKLLAEYEGALGAAANPAAYCIDSGAVLAAFGLRDCNDVDYIVPQQSFPLLSGGELACHNDEYREFQIPVDELVFNPAYHFSYKGVKYLSLETVLLFKSFRGAKKDLRDCRLIMEARPREPVGDRVRRSVRASYGELRAWLPQLPAKTAETLRQTLPPPLFRGVRYVFRTGRSAIRAVRGRM